MLAHAAPQAAGPCQRALPRPLVVTNFSDAPTNPLPGTLRYLEKVACAGETISFANHTLVPLADVLEIDRPMTITGGAITGGKLLVYSSDVTLSDLSLADTPIHVDPRGGGAGRLKNVSVTASLIAVNNPRDDPAIQAIDTDNLVVGGTGAAGNHIQTLTKVAVELASNGSVKVVGNTFDAGPASARNIAISESASTDLLVRDNTSNGDFFLEPEKGQVVHNTIDESGAAARAARSHAARGPAPTPLSKLFGSGLGLLVEGTAYTAGGHVLVDANVLTNAGIQTDRENIDITNNQVTSGATGLRATCGSHEIDNRGPIRILRNTVTDTIPGLGYICTVRTPAATIAHNVLHTNDARGIELTTKRAAVTANQVLGSGTKGSPEDCPPRASRSTRPAARSS